jgi:ABC-2 type transport system ATP-binding protein
VIGLTGQYAAVDDLLTGRENLEMLGALYHLSRANIRLRTGAALEVGRPSVLILDEPTTGLDPATRIDLWTAIQRLAEAGTTVLLTTQYLEEADRLASHRGHRPGPDHRQRQR